MGRKNDRSVVWCDNLCFRASFVNNPFGCYAFGKHLPVFRYDRSPDWSRQRTFGFCKPAALSLFFMSSCSFVLITCGVFCRFNSSCRFKAASLSASSCFCGQVLSAAPVHQANPAGFCLGRKIFRQFLRFGAFCFQHLAHTGFFFISVLISACCFSSSSCLFFVSATVSSTFFFCW